MRKFAAEVMEIHRDHALLDARVCSDLPRSSRIFPGPGQLTRRFFDFKEAVSQEIQIRSGGLFHEDRRYNGRSGFWRTLIRRHRKGRMWSLLSQITEPVESLLDPVDRHKSRLMSAILLLVVPVGIVSILLGSYSSDAELNPPWVYPANCSLWPAGLSFHGQGVH